MTEISTLNIDVLCGDPARVEVLHSSMEMVIGEALQSVYVSVADSNKIAIENASLRTLTEKEAMNEKYYIRLKFSNNMSFQHIFLFYPIFLYSIQ